MTTLTTVYDMLPAEHKSTGGPSSRPPSTSPSRRESSAAKTPRASSSELGPITTSSTTATASNGSPSSLAPESLSSASSFQSLSSKSSSGICVDSAPDSPDKSYGNVDIPGLDDLISTYAGISLGSSRKEEDEDGYSPNQTFASAADDTLTEVLHLHRSLQTFKTGCSEDQTVQQDKAKEGAQSSVLPYVSFEESVLRKHQEKSEEFKSALASFQLSVTGALDDQPSVPVANTDKINNIRRSFDSPDISFKEVPYFDEDTLSIVSDSGSSSAFSPALLSRLRETGTELSIPVAAPPSSLNKDPKEASNETQDSAGQGNILSASLNVVQEKCLDEVKREKDVTQDIGPENVSSTTQDSLVQEKSLNDTRDCAQQEDLLDKTRDIAVQENVLSTTQDIVEDKSLGDIQGTTCVVEQEDVADKTFQSITVQENVLSTTQDIEEEKAPIETRGIVQQDGILNKTQDIALEEVEHKTQDEEENVLSTTQDIVEEKAPIETRGIVQQDGILNKTHDITLEEVERKTQGEEEENVLSTTQDIVEEKAPIETEGICEEESILSSTQDIVQEKSLNEIQDSAKQASVLNETHDILQTRDILSTTRDIVVPETIADDSHESILSKTIVVVQEEAQSESQDIVVQENVLNTTQDIINKSPETLQENDSNQSIDIAKEISVSNETQEIVQKDVRDKTQDIIQENILNQTEDFVNQNIVTDIKVIEQEIVQDQTLDTLNKTQDIVQASILNKTQNIVGKDSNFNKTQDIVQASIFNDNLNKTTNLLLQESVLNKTQDIVKEKNILNENQDILRENTLNNNNVAVIHKTQATNKNQCIVQEVNANDIQGDKENRFDNSVNANEGDDLNETQLIVQRAKQHVIDAAVLRTEETVLSNKAQSLNPESVLKTNKEFKKQDSKHLIIETINPLKGDLSVQNTIKTPDKTELIAQIDKFSNSVELTASTPFDKSLNREPVPKEFFRQRSALFAESDNPIDDCETDFDATVVIKIPEPADDQLNVTSSHFSPPASETQQRSSISPVNEGFDLSEAALSVAKDIDASLEKIEENERFVSASELFSDPTAFDIFDQVSTQTTKRGERYDSLFMSFDPLAQRQNMLPQKNLPTAPSVEEDIVKESKPASPPATADPTPTIPNMNTPKKNPAIAAIDRLLFFSPTVTEESAPVAEAKQKKEVVEKQMSPQVPVVDEKMVKELELVRSTVLQLEAELEKQKKAHKEAVKEELAKQKAVYEERMASMQAKFTQMQSQLSQEVKCKDQMTVVVEEYEKSISRLIAEREKDRTNFEVERAKLQEELQVANQHLSNTEAAFSDVHSKYERLKNVVSAYKTNEGVLKESIVENQETIKTLENRYEQLKSHAMAQLEKANLELSAIKKHNEAETMKLKALVRKAELKSKSLEETVEQKLKENKELTGIIDEMIARVD